MWKKIVLPVVLVIMVLGLGVAALNHLFSLALKNIPDPFISSYLKESRTPSVAEIEEFSRMQLPKGYRNLKALSHVETRDETTEMKVKLSANRSEIKQVLSAAGFSGRLKANPEWRSMKNGEIKIPWWNPDGEKNVLTGYYSWRKPAVKYDKWTIDILVALPEKEPATLYIYGLRY